MAGAKVKTHRGAAKRFFKTGKGKIKIGKINRRHILTCKNQKRKRQLRKTAFIHATKVAFANRLIPYA